MIRIIRLAAAAQTMQAEVTEHEEYDSCRSDRLFGLAVYIWVLLLSEYKDFQLEAAHETITDKRRPLDDSGSNFGNELQLWNGCAL